MGNVNTCGPNEARVVSGGCCFQATSKKYIIGGWGWSWWCVTQVDNLALSIMTLKPRCESVETSQGVPLSVTGVAQVRVMLGSHAGARSKEKHATLRRACENFIGKRKDEIEYILTSTLEGHLRAILGQLTVQQIFQDREAFAQQVRDTATPDLGKMGIEVMSFIIQDVRDDVQYLTSIGKAQTAVVLKESVIGCTNAERDAIIQEAECEQVRVEAKTKAETFIDTAKRGYEIVNADCKRQISAAKTEAELAYEMQTAKEEQVIRDAEIEVDVIKRRKQIEMEFHEVTRKDRELCAKEREPANFIASKIGIMAEARKKATIMVAEAQATKIRNLAEAEAGALLATGLAEAEAMRLKASAMQNFGKEAVIQMILESLPGLAAEVAAPLGKVDEIVLLGPDNGGALGSLTKLLAEGPPVVKSLTGIDVSGALGCIPGAR